MASLQDTGKQGDVCEWARDALLTAGCLFESSEELLHSMATWSPAGGLLVVFQNLRGDAAGSGLEGQQRAGSRLQGARKSVESRDPRPLQCAQAPRGARV